MAAAARGYAYQSLGPREAGAVTGGQVLALASAEYQHPVGPPGWRLALFADAGNASDRWQDWTPSGPGRRPAWDSPIGPVGLDIACGQYTKQWQWNLSLGRAFKHHSQNTALRAWSGVQPQTVQA